MIRAVHPCCADAGGAMAAELATRAQDTGGAAQEQDLVWAETRAQLESLRALHSQVFGERGYIGPEAADKLISSWFRPTSGGQAGAAAQPAPAAQPAAATEERGPPGGQGADQGARGADGLLETAARMCDDVFQTIASVAAPPAMAAAGGEPDSPAAPGEGAGAEEADAEGAGSLAGVDFCEMPHALKAVVALRLQLPLRLALAAYQPDEEGFRQATGISAVRLVDDATYDAQARGGCFFLMDGWTLECLCFF